MSTLTTTTSATTRPRWASKNRASSSRRTVLTKSRLQIPRWVHGVPSKKWKMTKILTSARRTTKLRQNRRRPPRKQHRRQETPNRQAPRTMSSHPTRTSPSSPWRFYSPLTKDWPWAESVSSSWTDFPTTRRGFPPGKTASDTTSVWTTALSRFPENQVRSVWVSALISLLSVGLYLVVQRHSPAHMTD